MSVSCEKQEDLKKKMQLLGINEEDIEEKFIRSQGPGGQKVNKTSSCVVLKHKPTGIIIKSQENRSQSINRFFCRRKLVQKIEIQVYGKDSDQAKKLQKIKKQKKRKLKKTKEKLSILEKS
ncbi:MAG: peptide chain release factor-like protein [Candidatus Theseobacter exili]|nr:peptide chain release factor-like protein [Candidatus Theseobacter exili]